MDKNKPIDKPLTKAIDKIIHIGKPKPDETQKDFLKRKGVIRY